MKSIAIISITLLFLLQATVQGLDLCCELAKLPSMVAHYQEHASKDGTSVMHFIRMHYGSDDHSLAHEDENSHEDKLPFHGDHKCHHAPLYCTTHEFLIPLVALIFPQEIQHSPYHNTHLSQFIETPFQPPKG